MSQNNQLNAPFPLSATQGGLGVASPTAHGILVAEGASAATPIVLTAGQVLIGTTASDPSGATISSGTGINVVSATGAITINAIGGALSWSTVAASTQAAAINSGYITNDGATLVTVTLPATAAVGSVVAVIGLASGGWTLAANTGQTIQFGSLATTSGGSFSSTNQFDNVYVVCAVANTTWAVISSISAGLTKA